MNSIHQFTIKGIEGTDIALSDFAGKKMMIVNVASECGYTPQYQQLQELYEAFNDKLVIIGCPSNDFGNQEPGSAADIQQFCQLRYGVSFPLAEKLKILGPEVHPVYRWLTQKAFNGVADSEVRWNFQKYLLDEQGRLVKTLPSAVSPLDEAIVSWLQSEATFPS
ncbi:MAG: glutathione peroxidase [Bacteroidota bacterium]